MREYVQKVFAFFAINEGNQDVAASSNTPGLFLFYTTLAQLSKSALTDGDDLYTGEFVSPESGRSVLLTRCGQQTYCRRNQSADSRKSSFVS